MNAEATKAARPWRALALSGGGYLGLFTARVLSHVQAESKKPLAQRFDVICGTSIGGALALAAACSISMQEVVELFRERGLDIFNGYRPARTAVGKLMDLSMSSLSPKYDGVALRAAYAALFAHRPMGDTNTLCLIPAFDVTKGRVHVFRAGDSLSTDAVLPIVDVAMATSAVPAYFPPVRVDGDLYADGGLFAVSPDAFILEEFPGYGSPSRGLRVLSIGTVSSYTHVTRAVPEGAGALGWLSDARLMFCMLAAQQQATARLMRSQLGERWHRIDALWPDDMPIALDDAGTAMQERLIALADSAYASHKGWSA
jgi:predicted acylesterase/phospholipase RssA